MLVNQTPFLHKTYRLEWYASVWYKGTLIKKYGPLPTKELAEAVNNLAPLGSSVVVKSEINEIEIDPVFREMVQIIASKIESLVDQKLIKNTKRRRSVYLNEVVVRRALSQLARDTRELSYCTNLESSNASF